MYVCMRVSMYMYTVLGTVHSVHVVCGGHTVHVTACVYEHHDECGAYAVRIHVSMNVRARAGTLRLFPKKMAWFVVK